MKKPVKLVMAIILCSFFIMSFTYKPIIAKTLERPSDEEIIQFVKAAFQAQVSLCNKFYTYEEVNNLLANYFTDDYITLFNAENLVEQDGKYITYGKDFALYYIPFFKYDQNLKVALDKKNQNILVYEFFKATGEGMIMKDHYETVVIDYHNHKMKIKNKFLSLKSPLELHFQYKNLQLVQ